MHTPQKPECCNCLSRGLRPTSFSWQVFGHSEEQFKKQSRTPLTTWIFVFVKTTCDIVLIQLSTTFQDLRHLGGTLGGRGGSKKVALGQNHILKDFEAIRGPKGGGFWTVQTKLHSYALRLFPYHVLGLSPDRFEERFRRSVRPRFLSARLKNSWKKPSRGTAPEQLK